MIATKESLFRLIEFHGSILEKEHIQCLSIYICLVLLNRQKNKKVKEDETIEEEYIKKIIYFFVLYSCFLSISSCIEAFSKFHFCNHKTKRKGNSVIKDSLACNRCSTICYVIWEDQVEFFSNTSRSSEQSMFMIDSQKNCFKDISLKEMPNLILLE